MISPLRPGTKKALLIVLCLGALAIYVARAVKVYLAQSLGNSSQRESQIPHLERAAYLVPRNAQFPHFWAFDFPFQIRTTTAPSPTCEKL